MSAVCDVPWGKGLYKLQTISIKFPGCGYYLRWYYNGWHYWFFLPGKTIFETEGEKYRTIGTRKVSMGSGQITAGECAAIRTIMNTKEVYIFTDSGWKSLRIEPGTLIVYDNQISGYEIEFTAIIGSRRISSITGYSPVTDIPLVPPTPDPTICEVVIGTQIWMCKNYDIDFPGSSVYDNDEANRAIYGGLYTYSQVVSAGFCPTGWHLPTIAEWYTLLGFVGGAAVAGGELKEIGLTHWNAPNTGAVDTYGFTALGAGSIISGISNGLNDGLYLWCADGEIGLGGRTDIYVIWLSYQSLVATVLLLDPTPYRFSVRLLKDIPFTMPDEITIGTQLWKTHNYDENYVGSLPPNGDEGNVADYGRLYNRAMFPFLAIPAGWHVPTAADWNILSTYLGGDVVSGGKLKETGTFHWTAPNTDAVNSALFYARAAGNATSVPSYAEFGTKARWICSDLSGGTEQEAEVFHDNGTFQILTGLAPNANYSSIRLVRD